MRDGCERFETEVGTPLGRFALAGSARGLARVLPLPDGGGGGPAAAARVCAAEGVAPGTTLPPALAQAAAWFRAYGAGDPDPFGGGLDLRGSAFQLRVWRALLEIPFGATVTYGALATALGLPGGARAAGAALAANPLAVIVPCHRVAGAGGSLRGYAWGLDLKRRLLAHETARAPARAPALVPEPRFR